MRHYHHFLAAAVALYWLIGGALAVSQRGLQYDEALLVQGGVHLLNERTELPLPHDPDTWLCRGRRCLPLMTVRYVGAVKEYAGVVWFALFGTSALAVRTLSLLLAGFVVYGLGRLVGRLVSPPVGLAAAFALAIHPAFVDQSAFDNGTVAAPFCALGLLFIALARYDESPLVARALAIGVAAGFGVWSRANFTWVLFALVCALHLDLWRWVRDRRSHALAWAGGMLLGSLPFWIYQWISRGGTFAVFGLFPAQEAWPRRLAARGVMFAESLVSDREHRAIWGGGVVPAWQAWLFALVLVAALVTIRRRYPRVVIATVVLYALHFVSTVQVAEHHFVTVTPFAVAAVAATRWRLVAPVYVLIALGWQYAAWQGLRATGGVGQWSDAIVTLSRAISDRHQGRTVHIADWGLQNNLFVLSRGHLRSREWIGEERDGPPLERGGLFLTGGERNSFFPSGLTFARRLAASGQESRCEEFFERSGPLYARLCDVDPVRALASRIVSDTGLYPAEAGASWRWTGRRFSFVLERPVATDLAFALDVHVPPAVIEKLGAVTLNAAGLPAARYDRAGDYRYVRDLPDGAGPLEFALDKALPPSAADQRELGLIVRGLRLVPR